MEQTISCCSLSHVFSTVNLFPYTDLKKLHRSYKLKAFSKERRSDQTFHQACHASVTFINCTSCNGNRTPVEQRITLAISIQSMFTAPRAHEGLCSMFVVKCEV